MQPVPIPSHIHYETLLQLLERQTLLATESEPILKEQVKQLIIILRKALALQKQIESTCEQIKVPFDYRWAFNTTKTKGIEEIQESK